MLRESGDESCAKNISPWFWSSCWARWWADAADGGASIGRGTGRLVPPPRAEL